MANKQLVALELIKELVWWCISISIAVVVMYPITSKVNYSMLWLNGLFLVIAITYFRYAVLLKSVYVLRNKWVRFFLFLFNINFFVFVLRQQQRFMTIYDSYTIEDIGKPLHPLNLEQVYQLFKYFYNEISFTVVSCLGLIVALTVRFIWAYWQTTHLRLNAGNEE
jgi:hypothetical protein